MTMDEIHAWHGDASTDSLKPLCRYCNPRWEDKDPIAIDPDYDINHPVSRKTAIDYELAARSDPSHSFRDLRSPSKARHRHRQRLAKYFSFRGVNAGQLGELHHAPETRGWRIFADPLPQAPVKVMTKRQLYCDAQAYPRPPKLHRSKPWEKEAWGTSDRQNGPKHARQRFGADVEDAFESVRADGDGVFDVVVPWGPFYPRVAAEACGCECELFHRECHEQQRREWEAENGVCGSMAGESDAEEWEVENGVPHGEADESDAEEWEVLSAPESSSAEDLEGETAQADAGEDVWILIHDHAQPDSPTPTNPFTANSYFDEEGFLPCTPEHFLRDLSTGRCRGCIADFMLGDRRHFYEHARLSDVAFLRGMPVAFTIWTASAGVPFRRLLPYIAEIESGAKPADAVGLVRAARGPAAEEWYQMMEAPWWRHWRHWRRHSRNNEGG